MCHRATVLLFAFAGLTAFAPAEAQVPNSPRWRKLGNSAVETGLASPATGPVSAVWFASDGGRLFARTRAGKVFESSDLETWTASTNPGARNETIPSVPVRMPESGAILRDGLNGRLYALGSNVYTTGDNGRTWIDLTGYNGRSVIGGHENDLAVSPRDAQLIVVANDYGVWRSNDGGLSWFGLNEGLPNLPAGEIVSPVAGRGLEVSIAGFGVARLDPRGQISTASWSVISTDTPGRVDRDAASKALGAQITAVAGAGDSWYAGSADGRLWVSTDGRVSWTPAAMQTAGPIERIFVDAEAPRMALVAAAAKGPHIFRTINSGQTWDDITNNLADSPAHGITVDRSGGAVYVATDSGVFLSRMDLNALGAAGAWTSISTTLPAARAMDVKLDAAGGHLLATMEGFGAYATAAPHRMGAVRLVNSADLSQRAAAPGSLYSVVGAQIQSARGGGLNYPVLGATAMSSEIQVPFEASGSQVSLSLERAAGQLVLALPLKPVSPAIYVNPDGAPMLVDSDTGLMLETGAALRAHSTIQILSTGLGRVTPEWPSGMPAPAQNPPVVAAAVQAFLNGNPVEVTRATLAPGYVGMYVVEIQLPAAVDAGAAELYLVAGGQESNRVRVMVEAVSQ